MKNCKFFHKKCILCDKNNDILLTLSEYKKITVGKQKNVRTNTKNFMDNISYEKCEEIFEFYQSYAKEKSFLFLVKKDYFCSFLLSKNISFPDEVAI